MQESMDSGDSDRFKIVRRNSLRNEVDGSFEDLEDIEDRAERLSASNVHWVTHQECVLLNRVLSDKAKLPPACLTPPTAPSRMVYSQLRAPLPVRPAEDAVTDLVRRITDVVQPTLSSLNPLHTRKKKLGGVVTADQCQTLADYISPSIGGQYLLPTACVNLLDGADDSKLDEKEGAEGYGRLKRRKTVMAKESFPPTMC